MAFPVVLQLFAPFEVFHLVDPLVDHGHRDVSVVHVQDGQGANQRTLEGVEISSDDIHHLVKLFEKDIEGLFKRTRMTFLFLVETVLDHGGPLDLVDSEHTLGRVVT